MCILTKTRMHLRIIYRFTLARTHKHKSVVPVDYEMSVMLGGGRSRCAAVSDELVARQVSKRALVRARARARGGGWKRAHAQRRVMMGAKCTDPQRLVTHIGMIGFGLHIMSRQHYYVPEMDPYRRRDYHHHSHTHSMYSSMWDENDSDDSDDSSSSSYDDDWNTIGTNK